MGNRHMTGDVSVFSIGGASQLAFFDGVTLSVDVVEVEGKSASMIWDSPQVATRSGKLSTGLLSTKSGSTRVSFSDMTVLTINGVDLLCDYNNLNFNVQYKHTEGAGGCSVDDYPLVSGASISIDGTFLVDATTPAALGFFDKIVSGTLSDLDMVVSFTINGVATTLPCLLIGAELGARMDEKQEVKLKLKGKAPQSGTYPTAPTGTASLYASALTTPRAAYALVFASKAVAGRQFTFNAVLSQMSLTVDRGQLVKNQVDFATQGSITVTTTS